MAEVENKEGEMNMMVERRRLVMVVETASLEEVENEEI